MTEFNEIELDVAKEVINIGLSRAADSFSSIIKQKSLFVSLDLGIESIQDIDHFVHKEDSKLYNLITEIRGEMGGICYLIFSEREVEIIRDLCLPNNLNDPAKLKMMSEAIMLEVDNMIAAAVVAEFANVLKLSIYGDVPRLMVSNKTDSEDFINNQTDQFNYLIKFKAKLMTERTLLEPEFIWLLSDKFVEEVKRLTSDEKIIEKLKEMQE